MLRPSRVRREVCSGHRLRLRDVQHYSLFLSIIKSRWRALTHGVRQFSRALSVPRCAVFTALRTGHFDMGSKTDDAGRRDESKSTAIFRTQSVRKRFTACPLYGRVAGRNQHPVVSVSRTFKSFCRRTQANTSVVFTVLPINTPAAALISTAQCFLTTRRVAPSPTTPAPSLGSGLSRSARLQQPKLATAVNFTQLWNTTNLSPRSGSSGR